MVSAEAGYTTLVKQLIDAGAHNIYPVTLNIENAAIRDMLNIRYTIKDVDDFVQAAYDCNLEKVRDFHLVLGISTDCEGSNRHNQMTPLLGAVWSTHKSLNRLEIVKFLVEHDADVNKCNVSPY